MIIFTLIQTLVFCHFCIKSFEYLPEHIFLDYDEVQKLLPHPYLRKHTNSRNFCALFLLILFAMGQAQPPHSVPFPSAPLGLFDEAPLGLFDNPPLLLSDGTPLTILSLLRYWLIFLVLGHILISDYLFQIIPDEHLCVLVLLGSGNYSPSSFLGLSVGFLPFFTISLIAILICGNPTLGFGDVKLMSVLGLLTGPATIINVYIVTCLASGIFCSILLGVNTLKRTKKDKSYETASGYIPLAPFIILAFGFICHVSSSQPLPTL